MTVVKSRALEYHFMVRFRMAALVALVVLVPAVAVGQPSPGYPVAAPPVNIPQPPVYTSANAGVALPPAGYSAPPTAYPPSYSNPYGYPVYQGRVGGALSGAADVISAQGQYLVSQQQSRITQTQADMSRLNYRNALIEQQRYEKSIEPTSEEVRQRQLWQTLQTARNNPTNADVWSGTSLNSLLKAMQQGEVQGLKADPVPLPQDVLSHLNFTTAAGSGAGAGMLKEFANLQWPFALQSPPFLDGATKIQGLATTAIEEVKAAGRVSAATFNGLNGAVNTLTNAVASNQTLSPTDWILSKGFMSDLSASVQSLRNPDVAQYFGGNYSPKAGTVDELVRELTAKGLHFAPAAQGDQPSYTAMQQLMRTYDYRLASVATLSTSPR